MSHFKWVNAIFFEPDTVNKTHTNSQEAASHIPARKALGTRIISNLYKVCKQYPAGELRMYEVRMQLQESFAQGGFGSCFHGMLLQDYPVALKRIQHDNAEKNRKVCCTHSFFD